MARSSDYYLRFITAYEGAALKQAREELLTYSVSARDAAFNTKTLSANTQTAVDNFTKLLNPAYSVTKAFSSAAQFAPAFLGFEIVNAGLKTFSGLTVGSVRAAADFETGLVAVGKTTDLTGRQLDQLGENFKEISRTLPITTAELLEVGEIAGQIGISGVQNLTTFSKTIEQLSKTTNLAAEDSALSLARFQNIVGISNDQITNTASAIVDLGNKFASSETEISEFALRLAGAGKVLGLSASDILGFGNALASVGVNAEAGGTAFSRVFLEISSAVLSGSNDLRDFAEVAGMTSESFKSLVAADPSQAVLKFIQGLGAIKASGQDVVPILENLGLNNIRVRDSLLRSVEAYQVFASSITTSKTAFQDNIALQVEFEKKTRTTASAAQVLANNFRDIQISVGEFTLPAVAAASQQLSDFLRGLSGKESGVSASGDAINQVLGAYKQIFNQFKEISSFIPGFSDDFNVLATSIKSLATALTILASIQIVSKLSSGLGGITRFLGAEAGLDLVGSMRRTAYANQAIQTLNVALPRGTALGGGVFSAGTGASFPLSARAGVIPQSIQEAGIGLAQVEAFRRGPGRIGGRFGTAAAAEEALLAQAQMQAAARGLKDGTVALQNFSREAQALPQIQQGFLGLSKQIGVTGTALTGLQVVMRGLMAFFTSPTGIILGLTAAFFTLDALLKHFSGEGLIDFFKLGDDKARAFQKQIDSTTNSIKGLQDQVASGKLGERQAGLVGLTGNLGQTANYVKELQNAEQALKSAQNQTVASQIGLDTVPGLGTASRFTTNRLPNFLGGARDEAKEVEKLKGQLDANTRSLIEFAEQFNLTVDDIAARKIYIKNLELDPKVKERLIKDIDEAIKFIGAAQFSDIISTVRAAANLTPGAGPEAQAKFIDQVQKGVGSTVISPDAITSILSELQGQIPENKFYETTRELFKIMREQELRREALFKSQPDFFKELTKDAKEFDSIGPETIKKLNSQIQNLAVGGKLPKDIMDIQGIPEQYLQMAKGLAEMAVSAGFGIENLPLVVDIIKNLGINSKDAEEAVITLVTKFLEGSKAAEIFAGTLDGVIEGLKGIQSISDALNLSPDLLNKDAIASLQEFVLNAKEAVTGIKPEDQGLGIFFDVQGSQKQIELANQFGEALQKAVYGSFAGIQQNAKDSFADIKEGYNDVIDSIAASNLKIEERADLGAQAAKIIASFDELAQKNPSQASELKSYYLEALDAIAKRAQGLKTEPVWIDINFKAHWEEIKEALNKLAEGIDVPVRFLGQDFTNSEQFEQWFQQGGMFPAGQSLADQNKQGGLNLGGSLGNAITDAFDWLNKSLTATPKDVGGNIAKAGKELTQFQKDLIEIQKTLQKLEITAQEFINLNAQLGLTNTEFNLLEDALKNAGLRLKDFIDDVNEATFEKFMRSIGISEQAIQTGLGEKELVRLFGDQILTNALLQEAVRKWLSGMDRQVGQQTVPGFSGVQAAAPAPTPQAFGDIINKPTLAMIGEAGPEIVLPLSKPGRMKELLGKAGVPMLADGAIVDNWQLAQQGISGTAASVSEQAAENTANANNWNSLGTPVTSVADFTNSSLRQSLVALSGAIPLKDAAAERMASIIRNDQAALESERRLHILFEIDSQGLLPPDFDKDLFIYGKGGWKDPAVKLASWLINKDERIGEKLADFTQVQKVPYVGDPAHSILAEALRPTTIGSLFVGGGELKGATLLSTLGRRAAVGAGLGVGFDTAQGRVQSPSDALLSALLGGGGMVALGGGADLFGAGGRLLGKRITEAGGLAKFLSDERGMVQLPPGTLKASQALGEISYVDPKLTENLANAYFNLARLTDKDLFHSLQNYASTQYGPQSRKDLFGRIENALQNNSSFRAGLETLKGVLPENILGIRGYRRDAEEMGIMLARELENLTTRYSTATDFGGAINWESGLAQGFEKSSTAFAKIPRESIVGFGYPTEQELLVDLSSKLGTPIKELFDVATHQEALPEDFFRAFNEGQLAEAPVTGLANTLKELGERLKGSVPEFKQFKDTKDIFKSFAHFSDTDFLESIQGAKSVISEAAGGDISPAGQELIKKLQDQSWLQKVANQLSTPMDTQDYESFIFSLSEKDYSSWYDYKLKLKNMNQTYKDVYDWNMSFAKVSDDAKVSDAQELIDKANSTKFIDAFHGIKDNLGLVPPGIMPLLKKALYPEPYSEGLGVSEIVKLAKAANATGSPGIEFPQILQQALDWQAGHGSPPFFSIAESLQKSLSRKFDIPYDPSWLLEAFKGGIHPEELTQLADYLNNPKLDFFPALIKKLGMGFEDHPFANGGIVTGPTRALIGEAGPEAVVPLEKLNAMFGIRPGKLNEQNINNSRTLNISVDMPINGARDPFSTAQAARNRLMRISGRRERAVF